MKPVTLLQALKIQHPENSTTSLREFIKEGRITVDGQIVRLANFEVHPDQKVRLEGHKLKYEGELPIVYEDNHIIVVNKPSGLLSVATNYETEETAHTIIKRRHPGKKVFVIHRLDRETSGLMVFALTDRAFHVLKEELALRHVKRCYITIVEGKLQGKGTWDNYLQEDAAYRVHIAETGERAVTHYESLHDTAHHSLIRCTLETGKKHQIRVQAAHNGHPVIGDMRYGAKNNKLGRLALHAVELAFTHPITGKKLAFSSVIPEDFERFSKNQLD
jgi:tRNA pseudouridine32 synthase/23S rRNA pseudouridine746 synthase/23S rRNA pseudouridine1911/1915/1917 synthase